VSDVWWRIEFIGTGLLGLRMISLKENERMTDLKLRDQHSFHPEPSQPHSPVLMRF
jgi:hypothetical protein